MTVRILEIGQFCVFKRIYPESTTWLYPDAMPFAKARRTPELSFVSQAAFPEIRQRLLDGDYHLIVYFPPGLRTNAHGWFSPRSMIEGVKRRLSPLRKAAVGLLRDAVDTPLAVLDMDDAEPLDPANIPLFDRCRVYFKREIPADPAKLFCSSNITAKNTISSDSSAMKGRLAKLRPISLGLSRERIMSAPATPLEKTVDVFFAGCVAKRLVRKKGLPYLRSLAAKGIKVEESEGLPLNEYLQRCARAWLVWSPEGLGRDCFRHYEAPLCRVVPLINRAPVIRYRPLLDGTHCFYYNEEGDDLARVILSGLSDKPRLLKMAEAGHGHVLEYHTHEALCRYVMNEVL
jgi:hypothetical protein